MNLQRMGAVSLRQYYLLRSSMARLVPVFVWVVIDVILWGFITKYLNSVTSSGVNFVLVLVGAALFWGFFIRVMHGVTTAFMEDTWSRNFLNYFASPLTITEYVSGLVLTSIATSALGLVAMFTVASIVFGLSLFSYGIMVVPFLFVMFLFGIALGVFACGVMLRLGPSAEWFVWPIPALISPFVGVFYPLATLPHWMQRVGHLFPPSYVFESMRAIAAGGEVSGEALCISLGLALLYILLACWFFTRIYAYAVRSGLIARYSAENAS